ncbi:dihydrolipoamide dehydrogenase [Nitrosomonas cryotolerans]|uniref:Dihydrolipoamide dehydrogenase n=1 Tax=Nitrosomonas cryotolerans ATCC 49181 TaxID=1131553 RepID=A0A1N6GMF5_9PROT|nr:dihydrolipoyl dehydrogenase [Nitrosomonas cryotolerans]SFP97891.1 dihydrolipoamide dehydrogenase [Nitrosomonas cryotolerans]SIO08696.1 dihydrolipoamide dehydrogenase [Nitrosomonas cryotolerans ATCC 49181]
MYDVIILGAGSAGLNAASIFRKKDANYLIVHHGFKGTTCASRGCMPSKAFIQVAKSFHERRKFNDFGINGGDQLNVNIPHAMAHVRSLRDRFAGGIINGMDKYNIIYGQSRFIDPETIEVAGKRYQAKAFIICTGTSPSIPAPYKPYANDMLTTDNFFDQKDFPARIAVIGMGAIGIELGQALARLGVKVTGINRSNKIAGLKDAEILSVAKDILSEDLDLILCKDVTKVEKRGNGYTLHLETQKIECDKILLAAGRVPNLDGLGLEDIGVKFADNGLPAIDLNTLKIDNFSIYLSGDVNAYRPLLHEASDESEIVASQLLELKNPKRRVPLQITFTDPVIAQIGQQPDDIEEEIVTGSVSYDNQGRARIMGENRGMLKVYASKRNQVILGACMIAPGGEHLSHLLALAVQQKLTVAQLLEFPFYHPVLEEGLRTALQHISDPCRDCVTDRLC